MQSTGIPNVMVYELWAKLKWNSYNKITWTYHFAQLGYHVDHVNVAYDDSRYLYLQMVDGHPFASTEICHNKKDGGEGDPAAGRTAASG